MALPMLNLIRIRSLGRIRTLGTCLDAWTLFMIVSPDRLLIHVAYKHAGAGSSSTSRKLSAKPSRLPNVVIATAIPPNPCAFPTADFINKLSVSSKQDYAHLHGFEVHLSAGMINPAVTAVRCKP